MRNSYKLNTKTLIFWPKSSQATLSHFLAPQKRTVRSAPRSTHGASPPRAPLIILIKPLPKPPPRGSPTSFINIIIKSVCGSMFRHKSLVFSIQVLGSGLGSTWFLKPSYSRNGTLHSICAWFRAGFHLVPLGARNICAHEMVLPKAY